MSAFTRNELEYLGERRPERLARIATVGRDGTRTSSRSAGASTGSWTPSTWAV
jgi:hypothetical protein